MTTMQSQGFLVLVCFLLGCAAAANNPELKTDDLVTQTVYGFLDFTTTIGKTIMIFSPQSAPSLEISAVPTKFVDIIQTKPYSSHPEKSKEIYPTKLSTNSNQNKKSTIQTTETARKDYTNQPDYDLLSRQPETYAEESYHVVDLVSRKKPGSKKSNAAKDRHPVGLVTTLSGKIAMDGITTIHETSVIGTYISGKYAQVLQSNFHVLNNSQQTLSPTSTQRVLRTDAPTTRHFNGQLGRLNKNRSTVDDHRVVTATLASNTHTSTRKHSSSGKPKSKGRPKNKSNKNHRSSNREVETSSSRTSVSNDSRRYSFRQKLNQVLPASPVETTSTSTATNVKLRPVGRWQYKSTLKPRVYIRKASDFSSSLSPTHVPSTINEIELNTVNTPLPELVSQPSSKVEDITEDRNEATTLYPVETINIDIVTPSNLEDVYYEVATIKTPYTFQMGNVKKTRYVTVTSTTEKLFDSEYLEKSTIKGPLIENILAPSTPINQLLQASSITTFPACTLSDATETPSLDEYIETYTQSQIKLKTQVFPIVGQNSSTSFLTLLQTYGLTTVITATKTTPACLGNNFNEFNTRLDESGSELHLDLEFADFANDDQDGANSSGAIQASPVISIPNDVSSKKPSNDDQIPNYYPTFSPEQLQQLAYLKLFQQNPQVPQLPQIPIQPSQEVLPAEPQYESHVIPLIKNGQTIYTTLSKLIPRTEHLPEPSSQPQPIPSINPFGLQQPQYKLVTSATVQPTVLTQTLSRILKLTFGAKTALTTIYSTNTVTTNIATFVTTSLPVQPTAAFPNFFPPVFPQFPYIG